MEPLLFKAFLRDFSNLNATQVKQIKKSLITLERVDKISMNLETPPEKLLCPHCGHSQKWLWGKRDSLQRYKCKGCGKTFNSLSGTPLGRLRQKTKWLEYSQCLKEGLSIRTSAQQCMIHRNTSFKWRHRFLSNARSIRPLSLNGIVEADETYFLSSQKGSRSLTRKPRQRGGKATQRGLSKEQVCVLVCRDRSSNTIDKVFEHFNSSLLGEVLLPIISPDVLFCSDGKSVYKTFSRKHHIRHGCLNLSEGYRVVKDIVHIQNVNAYHSRLKRWIDRFHGVATKYLENYLSWFRELDEFNMNINQETFLLRAKEPNQYKIQPLFVT
jgi:Transposase and inactivated derivatives